MGTPAQYGVRFKFIKKKANEMAQAKE